MVLCFYVLSHVTSAFFCDRQSRYWMMKCNVTSSRLEALFAIRCVLFKSLQIVNICGFIFPENFLT